jgi:hypothetical protein
MENKTRFLPGFHWPTLRRKPRSAAQQLAEMRSRVRDHSLIRLQDGFGRYIAESSLLQSEKGGFSRRRLLSRSNTFWAFFAQILSADRGCKEVVRKLQSLAASKGMAPMSSSSSAYCQARSKLETASLEAILAATCGQVRDRSRSSSWKQRRVVVVDGTGVSMPAFHARSPGHWRPPPRGVRLPAVLAARHWRALFRSGSAWLARTG